MGVKLRGKNGGKEKTERYLHLAGVEEDVTKRLKLD